MNMHTFNIPEKCLVFVFAYMALAKYRPMFVMAIVNIGRYFNNVIYNVGENEN